MVGQSRVYYMKLLSEAHWDGCIEVYKKVANNYNYLYSRYSIVLHRHTPLSIHHICSLSVNFAFTTRRAPEFPVRGETNKDHLVYFDLN